jgi:dephospho-CoA kinase
MLRVGLTGGMGSGKSTVARMFANLGASVIAADEIGRALMQPGQPVYTEIVREFGGAVVKSDGSLDRKVLALQAFQNDRADALNRIVHPAVVAAEGEWMRGIFERDPAAIAIVESALIFEVEKWGTAPGWLERFDKLILVTASDEEKITRFVARAMAATAGSDRDGQARRALLEQDARARLAVQIPDEQKITRCDYVIHNTGPIEETRKAVEKIYGQLRIQGSGGRDQGSAISF